jgi:mono/diheme cytochrome c family protein
MIEIVYGFLKGLGYEHPIHSPLTHMPVGLVTGALLFFLLAIVFKREVLVASARNVSILALAFAFPVILLGVFDWMHFYRGILMPAIKIKMLLSGALLLLLGAGIVVGSEVKPKVAAMAAIYILSFAAVAGLAYFGASIVYGRGDAAGLAEGGSIGMAEVPKKASDAGIAALRPAPSDGERLFAANCSSCHAAGGNSIVASLPIRGSKRLARLETFETFLRAPAMPDGKPGDMPPFPEDGLSDAQAKNLYAYVSASYLK